MSQPSPLAEAPPSPAARPFRRVLLVNPPMASIGAEFMMEDVPLRLEYLASSVRGAVECVEVLDLANGSGRLDKALRRFRPDLVGISINYISTHVNGLALAKQAKAAGARVVIGGYQATAMVQEFAVHPDIDSVVRGEGEETLRELVEGKPVGEIRGLSYARDGAAVHNTARPLIADLDSIPLPDRTRRDRTYRLPFADLDGNVATSYDMIITSRGCWGRCTFCTEPLMSAGKQRYRRPEKIVEELAEIVKLHRGKRLRVHIADPNFGGNIRITHELCDRLIEFRRRCAIDLHFFVSVRTSTIANHPDLTKKMMAAGIDYLFVGMESPRNQDLRVVSKKGETQEKQELAVRYLREGGAEIMSNFLIGLPGQTAEDILGLVTYAKKLELADCYFSVVTPLPGSKLYQEALEKDLLLEKDITRYRLWDSVLKHDTLSRAKIREMCVRANAKWYDDLMLPAEHRRFKATGRKRRLHEFTGKFTVLINFFTFLGSGANKEFAELDPALFVSDMPNPALREFTERHELQGFLEMRRFLRVLGGQRIQVTLHSKGRPVTSWVAQTTPTRVEYVAAVTGAPAEKPTLAINITMDPGGLTGREVLGAVLRDNPDVRSRLALVRLAAAAGSEVLTCHVDRGTEALKTRARDLAHDGKALLSSLGRRLGWSAAPTEAPRESAPSTLPLMETEPEAGVAG